MAPQGHAFWKRLRYEASELVYGILRCEVDDIAVGANLLKGVGTYAWTSRDEARKGHAVGRAAHHPTPPQDLAAPRWRPEEIPAPPANQSMIPTVRYGLTTVRGAALFTVGSVLDGIDIIPTEARGAASQLSIAIDSYPVPKNCKVATVATAYFCDNREQLLLRERTSSCPGECARVVALRT